MKISVVSYFFEGVDADYLIHIAWKAIRMLQIAGLNVVCIVADGASNNRHFFRSHSIPKFRKSGVTYKAPNIFSPGEFVYFVADPPHLIKTVRNAWYNSRSDGPRHLEVFVSTFTKCALNYVFLLYRTMEWKLSGLTW